jgi:hypothetical protein
VGATGKIICRRPSFVGSKVGKETGFFEGSLVGSKVGFFVGSKVGVATGWCVVVGSVVGS